MRLPTIRQLSSPALGAFLYGSTAQDSQAKRNSCGDEDFQAQISILAEQQPFKDSASDTESALDSEINIEKLGKEVVSKAPMKELREISLRFKRNVIIQTQQKRQTKYVRKSTPS